MEKIAVAQEKANDFRTTLENPAGLGVGTETEAPDGLEDPRAGFPADLGAGIEHSRNRSYADARGASYIPNRCLPWNCFHNEFALCGFHVLAKLVGLRETFACPQVYHNRLERTDASMQLCLGLPVNPHRAITSCYVALLSPQKRLDYRLFFGAYL